MNRRKIEAALFLAGRERFTIGECEMLAKDLDAHDSMTFDLVGPTGRVKAKWLDAYFGLLQIGDSDGFVSAGQFAYISDIHCENLECHSAQGIVTPSGDETQSGSVERSEIEPGPATQDAPQPPEFPRKSS